MTLDTDGHQLQNRIYQCSQLGNPADKLTQNDSPVNTWNFVGIDPIAPSTASAVLYPLNLTESIRKREGDTPESGGGWRQRGTERERE